MVLSDVVSRELETQGSIHAVRIIGSQSHDTRGATNLFSVTMDTGMAIGFFGMCEVFNFDVVKADNVSHSGEKYATLNVRIAVPDDFLPDHLRLDKCAG